MDNTYHIKNCAVILLAAGASTRLGTSKQLLPYKGKSLLQNMVATVMNTSFRPLVVVVGANAEPIINELKYEDVLVINNTGWQEGIASSIRCGVAWLEKNVPPPDAVIIMVCDQPHITPALLNGLLITQEETGQPIVASSYGGITGTPALFHEAFFPALLSLRGDKGAGKLLQQQSAWVATVNFPDGTIDIDTPGNYNALLQDDQNSKQTQVGI